MKLVHNIRVNVFVKEDESEKLIKEKLFMLFPFDFEKEKIKLDKKVVKGFNEKNIIIYDVLIEKERHTNRFLKNLLENLNNEQKDLLIKQAETRIDRELDLFLRLDKEKLLDNKYWVTGSGNCFHIKFCLAVFPKNKENVLKLIEKMFS